MTSPTGDKGQQGEAKTDADHPLVEGRIRKEAQSEERKKTHDEWHCGAMNGAGNRSGDPKPIAIGLRCSGVGV